MAPKSGLLHLLVNYGGGGGGGGRNLCTEIQLTFSRAVGDMPDETSLMSKIFKRSIHYV